MGDIGGVLDKGVTLKHRFSLAEYGNVNTVTFSVFCSTSAKTLSLHFNVKQSTYTCVGVCVLPSRAASYSRLEWRCRRSEKSGGGGVRSSAGPIGYDMSNFSGRGAEAALAGAFIHAEFIHTAAGDA